MQKPEADFARDCKREWSEREEIDEGFLCRAVVFSFFIFKTVFYEIQ
jgi:hypothetical protein